MKVRMKVGMSGTIDGEAWPANGEVGEVPDVVAEKLIMSGQAVKASASVADPEVETRPAPAADVETTDAPAKRGPGRPRKT
jgi:hypothetical protein